MNESRAVTVPAQHAPAAPEDDEIDLGALLGTLWRGKWVIALITALAILAGGVYALRLATPIYPATAELALKGEQEQVMTDIESVLGGGGASSEKINTEIDVMTSRKILGRLVDRLNLVADPEFNAELREPSPYSPGALIAGLTGGDEPAPTEAEIREKVVDSVGEAISVTNKRESLTFTIRVETEGPRKSVRIANTLTELYIDNQLQEKFDANERASEFLSTRTAELKQELDTAESELNRFRDQAELVSRERLATQSAQLKDLRDRVSSLEADVGAARDRVDRLEALRSAGDYTALAEAADNPALSRALEAREAGTGSAADVARAGARVVASAETQLSRQEAQLSALRESAGEQGADLDRQSEELVRLRQLEREAESTRLLYESFLSRLKETNIQRGLAQAEVRTLSEAVPRPASSPKVPLILALSGVLGVMGGAGLVLGREAMHTGIRSSEELTRATGHTVLGTIPQMPGKARADATRYLREKPTSAAAEAVRNLRTSILMSNVDTPPGVIMVSSSIPGEGKTTLSIALAQNMVGLGQRVLLIEGDIRRRTFSNYFDTRNAAGLIDAMEDHSLLEPGSLAEGETGIDLLVGTKTRVNAADLFSSRKFRDFLTAARARYDHVIIDTPPVLVVPDARVIGREADAILFVVKWDDTGRAQIGQALEMFRTVELRITGLALTQIDGRRMKRYGYGTQYGYYASKSKYYDS